MAVSSFFGVESGAEVEWAQPEKITAAADRGSGVAMWRSALYRVVVIVMAFHCMGPPPGILPMVKELKFNGKQMYGLSYFVIPSMSDG